MAGNPAEEKGKREQMKRKELKRKEWKKQLRLGVAAIGMSLAVMFWAGRMPEVQAAEAPEITELRVTASEDGRQIMAQCDYQNYDDRSGCVMTLYLYRYSCQTDTQAVIAAYKRMPYAGEGREAAATASFEDGIYLATVEMDYDGKVTQINSRHYYQVTRLEERTEVTQIPAAEQEGRKDRGNSACIHDPDYAIVRPATAASDALAAYQCTICGEVLDYMEVPNSSYAAFLKEAVLAIQNARTEEVVINTDRWVSFNQTVLQAIAQRPDVTVIIRYQYQKEACEVTIPAGADVSALADENGFCGFRYLNQVFDENGM